MCTEADFCEQGQGCWRRLLPLQAPHHGLDGLVVEADPQVWFFWHELLLQGWSLDQIVDPLSSEVS